LVISSGSLFQWLTALFTWLIKRDYVNRVYVIDKSGKPIKYALDDTEVSKNNLNIVYKTRFNFPKDYEQYSDDAGQAYATLILNKNHDNDL
jgi:hypothetical protein